MYYSILGTVAIPVKTVFAFIINILLVWKVYVSVAEGEVERLTI